MEEREIRNIKSVNKSRINLNSFKCPDCGARLVIKDEALYCLLCKKFPTEINYVSEEVEEKINLENDKEQKEETSIPKSAEELDDGTRKKQTVVTVEKVESNKKKSHKKRRKVLLGLAMAALSLVGIYNVGFNYIRVALIIMFAAGLIEIVAGLSDGSDVSNEDIQRVATQSAVNAAVHSAHSHTTFHGGI